jgi:hypothetical protein
VTEDPSTQADPPPPIPETHPDAGKPGSHTTAFHPLPMTFCPRTVLWVVFFIVLTLAARCANFRSTFVTTPQGQLQVYYLDGDCYSRMTRVREILQGWGVIHYHMFENYPIGIYPHTTAPMDYLIVLLALLLKPFTPYYIDIAGAIVSPILGVMTTAFLALWARELNQQYRKLMLLMVSLSPILVHGQSLGRPAHHSLQIFLLAVGIGAELIMARAPQIKWSIISGIAWGLALWVSLYEPLVMFLVLYLTKFIFYRPKLFVKERLYGLGVMALILAIAYALEGKYLVRGFYAEMHDPILRAYFPNWAATIAEMSQTSVMSDLLQRWVGWGLLVSPLLLIARLRDTKRSLLLLALLVTTFAFTLYQIRWGYFFALVYVMSLPWQLSLFKRKWLVYLLFGLSLWPVAHEWDLMLPGGNVEILRDARLDDQARMRQAAEFIGARAPGGILAPWWWSAALAYWSDQPAVAGSSHEGMSGIVATARFFSTTSGKEAEAICNERSVETVVTGNPEAIVIESAHILGKPLPEKQNTMADILWDRPHSCPVFLHLIYDDTVIKVFEVNHGSVSYH